MRYVVCGSDGILSIYCRDRGCANVNGYCPSLEHPHRYGFVINTGLDIRHRRALLRLVQFGIPHLNCSTKRSFSDGGVRKSVVWLWVAVRAHDHLSHNTEPTHTSRTSPEPGVRKYLGGLPWREPASSFHWHKRRVILHPPHWQPR